MVLTEILFVVASAAAVALVGWLVYRYLVEFILIRRGIMTRGTIVSAVEMGNSHGGAMFVVSYKFSASSSDSSARIYHGRQLMAHGFRPKDVVVVRFWSKWPRINLAVDRAV